MGMNEQKRKTSKFYIGEREIGNGEPTYIIAEMSANHAGSIERAKEIIHAAKEAGADCVKIQTYTPDTLTILCNNSYFQVKNGTWKGENLYSLYGKASTPWEWHKELFLEAKKVGIDFFSTPFDKTSVDFLEECGATFYKIASFEMVDLPLLQYVAKKGKPMIVSTGMGTLEEIQEAIHTIYETGNKQLAILKCQSAYPATPEDMNLATITDMKNRFDIPIGLSDHSMGSKGAQVAVALGADIIEKHFCISRDIENPDASFSMTKGEFAKMVREIRDVESMIGKARYGVTKEEEASVVFRRSLFVIKDMEKGEVFSEENLRSIRPGYGMKPKYYEDMIGLHASHAIKRGNPLQFSDLNKNSILFLTNNENTNSLYQWLCQKEKEVIRFQNKLTLDIVKQLAPQFIISFNYSHFIKKEVIDYMGGKIINLHISYLPYNRGSAPNFFSFYENTKKGVTIHRLDEGLDTGDILCQKELFFDEKKETFSSSYEILIDEIKKLFKENWEAIKTEKIIGKPQVGEATCHKQKELKKIQENTSFSWNEVIAEVKKKINDTINGE